MEKTDQKEFTKVHCPNCANGRLFDLYGKGSGTLKIKCPVCRQEVQLQLEKCDEKRYQRLTAYYHRLNADKHSPALPWKGSNKGIHGDRDGIPDVCASQLYRQNNRIETE